MSVWECEGEQNGCFHDGVFVVLWYGPSTDIKVAGLLYREESRRWMQRAGPVPMVANRGCADLLEGSAGQGCEPARASARTGNGAGQAAMPAEVPDALGGLCGGATIAETDRFTRGATAAIEWTVPMLTSGCGSS